MRLGPFDLSTYGARSIYVRHVLRGRIEIAWRPAGQLSLTLECIRYAGEIFGEKRPVLAANPTYGGAVKRSPSDRLLSWHPRKLDPGTFDCWIIAAAPTSDWRAEAQL